MSKSAKELYDRVKKMGVSKLSKNILVREHTAVAIAPGGGHATVSDARIWRVNWHNYTDTVFVAGTNNDPPYTKGRIVELLCQKGRSPNTLEFQGFAEHTKVQADWLARQLFAHPEVTTLLLSTAKYHLPRFTLTFIKSWQTLGDGRVLHTALLPTKRPDVDLSGSPVSQTPEQEIARIEGYQKKGDIATYEEAAEFFGW